MATPAASSFAALMRRPVDRRFIDVSIARFTLDAADDDISAPMLG
jgi:hypothetical protein